MKLLGLVPLLAGCAEQIMDLRPVEIPGVCFVEEIVNTTVINGRIGSPLGTVVGDIQITQTVTGIYEDPNC